MKIVLPKTLCEYDPQYGPFFFLAGPVLGGGDWQARGVAEIARHTPYFYAALPCRYRLEHPLYRFRAVGSDDHFDRQLSWERHYLSLAATRGCLIFWLASEDQNDPRIDGLPYAMDTRGELGEFRGRLMHEPLRIVIGAVPDFPGLSQIQRNFDQALGRPFIIHKTLVDTVAAAMQMVRVR